ncbi:hypothetical protein PENSPDRAFT_748207 [Peniophora sp. CONT]|nr:hypothetical protein PENSPDRAFT_748207 [Peniophora sp. CONT]
MSTQHQSRRDTQHRAAPVFAETPSHSPRYTSSSAHGGMKRPYHAVDSTLDSDGSAHKPHDVDAYHRAKHAMDAFHSTQIRPLRPVYGNIWREGFRSVVAGTHNPGPPPVDQYGIEIKHPWYTPTRKSAAELRADMEKWGAAIEEELHGAGAKRAGVTMRDVGHTRLNPAGEVSLSRESARPVKTYTSDARVQHTYSWSAPVSIAGKSVLGASDV